MDTERAEVPGSAVRRSEAVRRIQSAEPDRTITATIVLRRPADAKDLTAIAEFARGSGLSVKEVSAAKHSVLIEGPVRLMNTAFGVELAVFEGPHGPYLSYDGPLSAPQELAAKILVLGLDQAPVAKPRVRGAG